jgi:antitoxin (DNA-binding transcriptional repressor) of toxin-antitoxin stability system
MKHIVLTAEQSQIIAEAGAAVEVRDARGCTIARLTPLTPDEMAMIERWKNRSDRSGPSIPSAEVQAHLRRLTEIRESEGMDEEKMLDLLRRMQAGEQV